MSDGLLDVDISGGTPPYTFMWSNGETTLDLFNLSTGMYVLTVTDASGCNYIDSMFVDQILILGPGWNYSLTASNHTILVQDTASLTIAGMQIDAGDFIGVFYDSLGSLVCSGYQMWMGTTVAIAAFGEDNGNDGFVIDEEFNWKIWDASENMVYDVNATYIPIPAFPNEGQFAINGMSALASLSSSQSQLIDLPLGWSIMSTYIEPISALVDEVFAPVVINTVIVKDGAGQVYWPAYALNMIGDMEIGQGYQVKMLDADILEISGIAVIPELTPILIPANWSIIGYLRNNPGDAAIMTSSLMGNLIILKDDGGQVYWPDFGLNMIGNMLPGKGYQFKLYIPATFTYPANSILNKSNSINSRPEYYLPPVKTGSNMTIGIPVEILNNLEYGDEIGIFDSYDNLFGSSVFETKNMAIAAFGDDELTNEKDGLCIGEDFTIKTWSKNENSESIIVVLNWDQGNEIFMRDKISIIGKIDFIKNESNGFLLFPNPAKSNLYINIADINCEIFRLNIYSVDGNLIHSEEINTGAGLYSIYECDISAYQPGNYLINIVSFDFSLTKPFVKIR